MPEDTRFHPNMIILIPNNTKTVTHSREYYNMSIDNNHNESIQITLKFSGSLHNTQSYDT